MILSYIYPIRTGRQTVRAKQGAAKAAKHHHKRLKGARGQGGECRGGRPVQGDCFRAWRREMTGTARQGARLKALDAMRRGPGGACPWRAHYAHNAPMKAPTFKTGERFSGGKNRHAPLPPPLFKICLIPNQSYTGWSFFYVSDYGAGGSSKTGRRIRFP